MRKRPEIWLLALVLLVALGMVLNFSACAKQKATASLEPYSTARNGTVYSVTPTDETTGTITDGTYTYSYRYASSGTGYSVTFTYPDGETYTWTENGNISSGSTSPDFDSGKYPDGMTLDRVLKRSPAAKHEEKSTKSWGIILFLLFAGGINTACPQLTWHLDVGWKVKNAEPSEAALAWSRGTGIVMLVIAAIMLLV